MGMDYFSIGYESEAAFGRAEAKFPMSTPQNKREVPCDSCSLAEKCAVQLTECSAFRNWSHDGDYKDSDVGRFIRVMKKV